ncbi:MAG: RHS repeat-associated core domain-containing protein, partial [Chitinophagaceae bacterium]
PFGSVMPGRKFASGSSYRYGFNGKENDNDVKGEGNQQDYGKRIYDPRLGKFLSVDPLTKTYPSLTPYQFASNSPIKCIDLDGLEGDPVREIELWLGGVWDDLTSAKRWKEVPKNLNETLNPIYIGANHAYKIATGKDFDGKPNDFRGTSGAVSDAGVDVMGFITGQRFFKILGAYGTNALESELNSTTRAIQSEATPKPPPNKPAIQQTTATETKQAAGTNIPKQSTPVQLAQAKAGSGGVPLPLKPSAPEQIQNGCEALAKKVQKAIGGDFLQITPKEGSFLGPANYSGGTVNNWRHHVAVVKDGIVYDRMTGSGGIPIDKYKELFTHSDALKFEQVKTITVK